MSTANDNQYKVFEYGISPMGSEILVVVPRSHEESLKDVVNNAKEQMERLIYEFVYTLGASVSNSELSNEFSYYSEILSRDSKFMNAVEKIYKDRHKGFDHGYEMLRNHDIK